jgi:hypothetical protein
VEWVAALAWNGWPTSVEYTYNPVVLSGAFRRDHIFEISDAAIRYESNSWINAYWWPEIQYVPEIAKEANEKQLIFTIDSLIKPVCYKCQKTTLKGLPYNVNTLTIIKKIHKQANLKQLFGIFS